ncbi:DUF6541 family protein [Microbacterium pygmaeum]|uniref:4-amino-4-deoxy-L-arabinose transferase n=1 Tax=Microbacterium pygmaeum TaxID=370764 RepID=A0A1G8CR52_9MICO|nr:DUF6541 family protein [Microbacterium pygmaeum]SDH47981.1 hypothetical protein SAMN04489810_3147 [Microbacterium pygmaeum]
MSADWLVAVAPFAVSALLFIVPGLIVRLVGWNVRAITPYLLAPAISTAIVAVAANAAPVLRLPWTLLPVALVTLLAAGAAFGLRRWVGPDPVDRPHPRRIIAAAGGLLLAGTVVALQLIYVFGGPDTISQTFDSIIHLNSIRFALDAGSSSALTIGATSDIGFYPNAWQSFVTLSASLTGVDIPTAVNATNIAVGALVWPASAMALAAVLFRERAAALAASAALSTGFGAFPILLFYFGVLYPNAMGYANLGAGVAALVLLLRARTAAARVREAVLLLVVCAAIGLGHPNAFLALFAIGAVITLYAVLRTALIERARRVWVTGAAVAVGVVAVGAGLWQYSRTGFEMSRWGPWQSTAQAFGEAILASPRGYPITIAISVLLLLGILTLARRPVRLIIGIPFAVAAFMFVLASGAGTENPLRELVTNPWYNDSFRLAALLPFAAIPVATFGAVVLVDFVRGVLRRWSTPRLVSGLIATIAALALFGVGVGPNVTRTAQDARGSYAYTPSSALVTSDEAALLARLDTNTPQSAVILGNPWTGTSLAYALSDRNVVERHIFGTRSDDEVFLDEHLREIEDDPRVCAALSRLGVDYVLDFGTQNVFNSPDSGLDHTGLNDLVPSRSLVLVDSEGPAARLFRVEGC